MKQEGMENTRGGVNVSNPLYPLEYFPSRVNRVVVTVRMMAAGGCAGGAFDPKTNVAYIPVGNAARDRAIRRHEASHANLLPLTEIKMTALWQGVEDMRIHTLAYPYNNDSSRRDELVFALGELRDCRKLILPVIEEMSKSNPSWVRVNMVPIVRSLAILHYGVTNRRGCESKAPEARVAKAIARIVAAYEKALGMTGLQAAIAKAVTALEHDDVAKATSIMRPFMTMRDKDANLNQPKQQGGQSKSQQKQDKKNDKEQSPSVQISADDDEEQEEKKEQKSKPAPKEPKEEKSDKKEKAEESDEESDDNESGSDSESDEDAEDESEESGDAGDDESDEESDEDGNGDSEGDDSDSESQGDDDSDADQGDDVPCNESQAAPTGTKGGIGDCGADLQQALEDNRITAESIALLDPETIKSILDASKTSRGLPNMRVRKLDYRMSKKITQGIDYRLSNSGSRINVSRIPRIFDPKPGKIFERIGEQKGGTVVIDASSSMNLENERLEHLAENLPIGQIAYYSGMFGTGTLVIYSKDGRSYKLGTGEKLPDVHGGNVVDFQAMQWLLKQPAPRWFISDTFFCGSATSDAATELAQRAYARKLVTFFSTLGEIEVSLHMRNELDEHDKMMFERAGGDNLLKRLSPCPVCEGNGQLRNPDGGSQWPEGGYYRPCGACNGKGHRKLQ